MNRTEEHFLILGILIGLAFGLSIVALVLSV